MMLALSIRQPWAWLIVHGFKDVENRTWTTEYRGRFLVHAGKAMTSEEYDEAAAVVARIRPNLIVPPWRMLERGGIVGEAELTDCVTASVSPWFGGPHGFVVRDAKVTPFVSCPGALKFFDPVKVRSGAKQQTMQL